MRLFLVQSNTGVGVYSADGNVIPSIGLVLLFVDLSIDYFFLLIFFLTTREKSATIRCMAYSADGTLFAYSNQSVYVYEWSQWLILFQCGVNGQKIG